MVLFMQAAPRLQACLAPVNDTKALNCLRRINDQH